MQKKKGLKGRRERIVDDWTWKKRKMRWKLEKNTRKKTEKGRKVWIGYGGLKIDISGGNRTKQRKS